MLVAGKTLRTCEAEFIGEAKFMTQSRSKTSLFWSVLVNPLPGLRSSKRYSKQSRESEQVERKSCFLSDSMTMSLAVTWRELRELRSPTVNGKRIGYLMSALITFPISLTGEMQECFV